MNKTDKIYVAGHRGLVGSAIVRNLQAKGYTNIIGRTHKELDLTNQAAVRDLISISKSIAKEEARFEKDPESMSRKELEKLIADIQKKMKKAAAELDFETAAELRDKMMELKTQLQKME